MKTIKMIRKQENPQYIPLIKSLKGYTVDLLFSLTSINLSRSLLDDESVVKQFF